MTSPENNEDKYTEIVQSVRVWYVTFNIGRLVATCRLTVETRIRRCPFQPGIGRRRIPVQYETNRHQMGIKKDGSK